MIKISYLKNSPLGENLFFKEWSLDFQGLCTASLKDEGVTMVIEARAEYRFRGKLIGSGGVFMNVLEMKCHRIALDTSTKNIKNACHCHSN